MKTQVSDHLDAAPAVSSRMSPELQASLRASIDQAKKLQEFYVYLDDIAARAAGTDSAVTSMVSRATGRFNLRAEARQLLKDAGEEILQDVTCDFAWRLMAPDEQSAVSSSGFDRVNDVLRDLEQQAPQVIVEAIGGYLQKRFLGSFNDPEIVEWGLYASDVYEKAGEWTADGQQTLTIPDAVVTKALVQYVRFCLRPPH